MSMSMYKHIENEIDIYEFGNRVYRFTTVQSTLLMVSVLAIHDPFKQKRCIGWGKEPILSRFEHHLREREVTYRCCTIHLSAPTNFITRLSAEGLGRQSCR